MHWQQSDSLRWVANLASYNTVKWIIYLNYNINWFLLQCMHCTVLCTYGMSMLFDLWFWTSVNTNTVLWKRIVYFSGLFFVNIKYAQHFHLNICFAFQISYDRRFSRFSYCVSYPLAYLLHPSNSICPIFFKM